MKRRMFMIVLGLMILAGCRGKAETNQVRVAVLPVLDTLPMHVAAQEGIFEKYGVEVELIPVSSAPERDQLMQGGQAEAMMNELVVSMLYNKQEPLVTVVRFARVATSDYPLFRILASSESGITSVEELKGVPIGISEGTVIEYTTDRLLENAGFSKDEIAKIAVPKIPDRLALLASGELDAANLPDPVASLAVQQGAVVVIDDTAYPEISHSVITFSASFAEANPGTVEAFLNAYEEAVALINADKDRWTDLFVELGLVPPPLVGTYKIPDFPAASVPSEAQFDDSLAWLEEKGLIDTEMVYGDTVSDAYLP